MPDSFLDDRVRVLTGDITAHDVIAIVNAATRRCSAAAESMVRSTGSTVRRSSKSAKDSRDDPSERFADGRSSYHHGGRPRGAIRDSHQLDQFAVAAPRAKRSCLPRVMKTRCDSRPSTQFHPSLFLPSPPARTAIRSRKPRQSPPASSKISSILTIRYAKCGWSFFNRRTRGCFWSTGNSSRLSGFCRTTREHLDDECH